MSETGDKIRAARKAAGLTQGQLAERMRGMGRNWAAQNVSDYERGRYRPTVDLLRDIASAIGCDVTDLI
jgi:transcriptional regulator with XRE-family HTH domain